MNKKLTELTQEEHAALKRLGMLWEFYPTAIGVFDWDVPNNETSMLRH